MKNQKTIALMLGCLLIGALVGGLYVNQFGTNLPLHGQGVNSKAFEDELLVEETAGDVPDCGGRKAPCKCAYYTANGVRREGVIMDYGGPVSVYICQSNYGWSRNWELI
jgi:hypothetical protein